MVGGSTIGFFTVNGVQWYCLRLKGHDGEHGNYLHPDATIQSKKCGTLFDQEPAAAPAEGPPHRDTRVPPDLSDDPEGEHCYDCGQAVGVVWTAPDALWAEVTNRADGGGLLCVRCFDRRAEQRGQPLRWVPQPLGAPAEGLTEADFAAAFEDLFPLTGYAMEVVEYAMEHPVARYFLLVALARHESGSE